MGDTYLTSNEYKCLRLKIKKQVTARFLVNIEKGLQTGQYKNTGKFSIRNPFVKRKVHTCGVTKVGEHLLVHQRKTTGGRALSFA